MGDPLADEITLLLIAGGRYTAMGGGAPLAADGKVIAGIGVSGGTTEQDIAIVESAVKWIGSTENAACRCQSTGLVVHRSGGP